jgi:hypothetical protein
MGSLIHTPSRPLYRQAEGRVTGRANGPERLKRLLERIGFAPTWLRADQIRTRKVGIDPSMRPHILAATRAPGRNGAILQRRVRYVNRSRPASPAVKQWMRGHSVNAAFISFVLILRFRSRSHRSAVPTKPYRQLRPAIRGCDLDAVRGDEILTKGGLHAAGCEWHRE